MLVEVLAEAGIDVPTDEGTHRVPCPRCRKGRRDDALVVTIKAVDDVVWFCHRCAWSEGWRPESPAKRKHAFELDQQPTKANHGSNSAGDVKSAALAPYWRDLWRRCQPITADSPAGRYLAARRCASPPPEGDLRWIPGLKHPTGGRWPALVGLITDAVTGAPISLHRTYLDRTGEAKAPVKPPRLYLKDHSKKGVVRLWPDTEVSTGLAIGEGIETCLAAARAFTPIWAALDAGNLARFPVITGIEALTIVADQDETGIKSADSCAARWAAADRDVHVWTQ